MGRLQVKLEEIATEPIPISSPKSDLSTQEKDLHGSEVTDTWSYMKLIYKGTNTTCTHYTGNSKWNCEKKPFEHDQEADKIFDEAIQVLCIYS